ncbi:MAG: hypothetical protein MI755_13725, partial [Sphingomonadales bacterium]|nr:hypothetical protein [Sphingomonadales bacterium]
MKINHLRSCAIGLLLFISSHSLAQDTTSSDFFALAAFGGGFATDVSSCNTSSETIFRRTIVRGGESGDILHEEQGFILPGGCNINFFEDSGGLTVATLEQEITAPTDAHVITSLFLRYQGNEIQMTPTDPVSSFAISLSEGDQNRSLIAMV